jgi:hypothetical protein
MDDANTKAFARAVARALGQQAPAQAPPAPSPVCEEERPDVFMAIHNLFELQDRRIDELERRIAELEAKPAARSIEHVRDSNGQVIRSVVLETPAP